MFRNRAVPASSRARSTRIGQGSLRLFGAVIVAAAGAGFIVGLPAFSSNAASDASVRASAEAVAGAATQPDTAACDRQSWPYLDQRCIDPSASGTELRQVRVISLDRVAPATIVTMAAPAARVAPQNSMPVAAPAAPQSPPISGALQIGWLQLALLAQSNLQDKAAKEPARKATSQTKAPARTTRVAMAPLAGQAQRR